MGRLVLDNRQYWGGGMRQERKGKDGDHQYKSSWGGNGGGDEWKHENNIYDEEEGDDHDEKARIGERPE